MDARSRILSDGFDEYGYPREYEQQFPTPERAAKAGGALEGPEVSRTVIRHHTRIKGMWELMVGRGTINDDQRAAGERLTAAVAGLNGSRSIGYGLGSGGGGESESSYKERCRETISDARSVLSPEMFLHLYAMAEGAMTTEGIGVAVGARSKRNAYRLGSSAVRDALQRLVDLWRRR